MNLATLSQAVLATISVGGIIGVFVIGIRNRIPKEITSNYQIVVDALEKRVAIQTNELTELRTEVTSLRKELDGVKNLPLRGLDESYHKMAEALTILAQTGKNNEQMLQNIDTLVKGLVDVSKAVSSVVAP